MSTIPIRTRSGWTGFAADGGAGSSGYLVGPASKGAPYPTLAEAVAAAVSEGAQQPVFYLLSGADYSANVTLPQDASVIGVDSSVIITGQIQTSGVPGEATLFENVGFLVAAAVTGLEADYAGTGGVGQISLRDVQFQVTNGGVGFRGSALSIVVGQMAFGLDNGVGIALAAGNAAGTSQLTELEGVSIDFVMENDNDVGVQLTDGVGGDDVIGFTVDAMRFESHAGGTGIRVNNTSAPSYLNGLKIGSLTWSGDGNPGGIAVDFIVGSGTHQIGSFLAQTDRDTLVAFAGAVTGQILQIGTIEATGTNAGAGPSFDLDGKGSLQIFGGLVTANEDPVFQINDGFTGNLLVSNVSFHSGAGTPTIASTDTSVGECSLLFTDCSFLLSGNAGSPKFNLIGSDAAFDRELGFVRCDLDFEGTDISIRANNFIVDLQDTNVLHDDNTVDAIQMTVSGGQPSRFSWAGSSVINMASGGAGRALNLAGAAAMSVEEKGLLQIVGCTPGEQLNLNGGGQTLVNSVGRRIVAQGSIATWANGDALIGYLPGPVGTPSSYPGLHICSEFDVSILGTAGDDSGNQVDLTNEDTGLGAAGVTIGTNPGAGAQGGNTSNFADFLLGPGQLLSAVIASAGTAPTDVRIAVS